MGKGKKKGKGKKMAETELTDATSTFEADGADEATRQSMRVTAGKVLPAQPKKGGKAAGQNQEPRIAGAGDTLTALMDQPMRKAPQKSASQLPSGVKNGSTCTVERTDTDPEGVHRMQVTFTDKKGKAHTGWVRQNDRTHRYFRLADAFAGVTGVAGPGMLAGHGNRLCWDGATVTAGRIIITRKAPSASANHSFKLKAGEQGLCTGTAVTNGVEYGRVVGPLGHRKKHEGWIEMKPGVLAVEGGGRGMGTIDPEFSGGMVVGGAAVAEGVPPKGAKKGPPPKGRKKEPPKKMSKKEKKAFEKAERDRQEQANRNRVAQLQSARAAVEAERAQVEAEMQAAIEAEKSARLQQLVVLGKQQMAQEQFAEAQKTFQTAMALHVSDEMDEELEGLFTEAHDCREAAESVAEAELFLGMNSPKLAVQRFEEATRCVAHYPVLLDRYTKALAGAREAVAQMEAREKAEEEELERLHEEELRQQEEQRLFEQMENVRVAAKQDLERAHNRRECRDIANLVQKTLALDPDKKFKKRTELQTTAQRAIKKARAFRIADAAAELLDDGFVQDAVDKYQEALALDPVNSIISSASEKAASMLEALVAQADKAEEAKKVEKRKKKGQLLLQTATAQIEEAEYYAAATTLESALAGKKYLDPADVESMEQMLAKAEKQGEAKQLCSQGLDLIMRGKTEQGLKLYARASALDPDNERWPAERDTAIADRNAKEEEEAAAVAFAKSQRKERKAAEKAAKQAAKRDNQVAKMAKQAGIQFKSKKYQVCTQTCSQALGMIEEDHPQYEELVALQKQADGIINVTDMTARSQELIDTKDYTGAKKMLEDALAVAPAEYPVELLQHMLLQTTANLEKQEADRQAKLTKAEALKQQELTRAKAEGGGGGGAAAAEVDTPERAETPAAPIAPPKAQAMRSPDNGLGTFMCDNDINVKGAVLLGKVSLMISCTAQYCTTATSLHFTLKPSCRYAVR
eukprot:COSAG02_NODE_185_length_30442_cov_59.370168_21_plen_975_part_00